MEKRSYQSIWDDLSEIDCSDYTEVKDIGRAKLTYLSWAWAWGMMMTKYPDLQVEWMEDAEGAFTGVRYARDGSAMVHCRTTIPDGEGGVLFREMWLPVMDGRNQAIKDPDAREISDAKMRCLVKCFALWGMGHYIYAGEDIPHDPAQEKAVEQAIASLKAHSRTLLEELKPMNVGLDPAFVEQCKEAIGKRDLQPLKKLVAEAQHKVVEVREAKAQAEEVNLNPDDESEESDSE